MLDGETLTLPSELASTAGFNSARLSTPFAGEDSIVPPDIAAAMGVDALGNFRSPTQFATLQMPNGINANGGRSLDRRMLTDAPTNTVTSSYALPAISGLPTVSPEKQQENLAARNASLLSAGIDPTTTTSTTEQIPSFAEPHPMYSDPRFQSLRRQNPSRAASFYEQTAGRSLAADDKLYAANQVAQIKRRSSTLQNLSDKLSFDEITGEPYKKRIVEKKDVMGQPTGETMTIKEPLSDVEQSYINQEGGYEKVFGLTKPTGINVPKGLTPEETVRFRQDVKNYMEGDKSPDSDTVKLSRAYKNVHKDWWNQQNLSTAVTANTAAVASNQPGGIAKFVAHTVNMGNALSHIMPSSGSRPTRLTAQNISDATGQVGSYLNQNIFQPIGETSKKSSTSLSDLLFNLTGGSQ